MPGTQLDFVFSILRANDLVWPYVVNNYLRGARPAAFDILYWNSDGTNLPGPMFCYYLRNTYLEEQALRSGRARQLRRAGGPRAVTIPAFVFSTREDHIVPWRSAYRTLAHLGSADKTFILGASGHIAGVINPPGKTAQPLGGRALSGRSGRLVFFFNRSARQLVAGVVGMARPARRRQAQGAGEAAARSTSRSSPRPVVTSSTASTKEAAMEEIYIVGAARTPIGKFGGSLAKTPASDLGALVIRKVLERAGVAPEQVSEVIMGQVLAAGVGQNPARQAAIRAGLPDMIPAMTINKVCGSGSRRRCSARSRSRTATPTSSSPAARNR